MRHEMTHRWKTRGIACLGMAGWTYLAARFPEWGMYLAVGFTALGVLCLFAAAITHAHVRPLSGDDGGPIDTVKPPPRPPEPNPPEPYHWPRDTLPPRRPKLD